jgi:hypothetical protein
MPNKSCVNCNYDLTEITRLLLKMRDNCVRKAEGEAYDDPERKEKYEALEAAIDLINNPSMMQKWISVKERLPETDNYCLVFEPGYGCEVCMYYGDGEWLTSDFENVTRFVEYWMPLPEPPKEET